MSFQFVPQQIRVAAKKRKDIYQQLMVSKLEKQRVLNQTEHIVDIFNDSERWTKDTKQTRNEDFSTQNFHQSTFEYRSSQTPISKHNISVLESAIPVLVKGQTTIHKEKTSLKFKDMKTQPVYNDDLSEYKDVETQPVNNDDQSEFKDVQLQPVYRDDLEARRVSQADEISINLSD